MILNKTYSSIRHLNFLFSLPKYLNNVHGFDIASSAGISALPYICMFIVIIAQGRLSDYLLRKNIWARTTVRRVFNSIGLLIPGLLLSVEKSFSKWNFHKLWLSFSDSFGFYNRSQMWPWRRRGYDLHLLRIFGFCIFWL